MKRKVPFLHIIFSAVLFWLSAWSFACNPAQGSGQCGYYDQYGRYQNTAIGSYVIPPPAPSIGYEHSTTSHSPYSTTAPSKYDRFGAVAISPSTGFFAVTEGMKSPIDAANEALKRCAEPDCELHEQYSDTCVSVFHGKNPKNGLYYFQAREGYSISNSKDVALRYCKEEFGLVNCKILHSACSLPKAE